MAFSNRYVFSEESNTDQAIFILWEEKLPQNFYSLLDKSGFGFIVSPLHEPDEENKKPHRHLIIRDMHSRSLEFEKVDLLLKQLNGEYMQGLVLRGGHSALVSSARYFIHLQQPDKQQYDIRAPDGFDKIEIDNDGKCLDTGLTSIFAEYKCFYDGGGLDFLKLIHITEREKADLQKQLSEINFKKVCEYIYGNNVSSFSALARWCLDNCYSNTLCRYGYVLSSITHDIRQKSKIQSNFDDDKKYKTQINKTDNNNKSDSNINYNVDRNFLDTYTDILYSDVCRVLEISTISPIIIQWLLSEFPYLSAKQYTDLELKRLVLKNYDYINGVPRRYAFERFKKFCLKWGYCYDF